MVIIDTTDQPLVSVLMTLYNRSQFIEEAVESVLNSTYKNFELIIVDDKSSDNSVALVKKYLSDHRIKLYENEFNIGDYPNRNKAAGYAQGKYIMYVDSDDILNKTGIEDCIKLMSRFKNCAFGIRHFYEGEGILEMSPVEAIHTHFFKKPYLHIGPGGTIQELSFFKSIGGYPEKYGPANDMYYNLKAAIAGKVVFFPFEFLHYRRHADQQINNKYSYIYNNYLYLEDALNELDLPVDISQKKWLRKKNKRRFFMNVLSYFFKTRNVKMTLSLFKKTRFSVKDLLHAIFN